MSKEIKYKVQKMTPSERELLQSVALKLKDKVLFPELLESARKFVDNLTDEEIKMINSTYEQKNKIQSSKDD